MHIVHSSSLRLRAGLHLVMYESGFPQEYLRLTDTSQCYLTTATISSSAEFNADKHEARDNDTHLGCLSSLSRAPRGNERRLSCNHLHLQNRPGSPQLVLSLRAFE